MKVNRFLQIILALTPLFGGLATATEGTPDCPAHFSVLNSSSAIKAWWAEAGNYWKLEKDALLFSQEDSPPIRSVAKYLKHGARLSFAPMFLTFDIPLTALRVNSVLPKVPLRKRMLLVPLDLAHRHGPHMLGYTALAVSGYSWKDAAKNLSYLDDFDTAIPRTADLKPNELAVFVYPPGDPEIAEKVYKDTLATYAVRGISPSQIKTLRPASMPDFLKKLGELRSQGRIKYLYITAHGKPGEFNLNSGPNFLDGPDKGESGVVNAKVFPEWAKEAKTLPHDLFTEDAKLAIYSCSFAQGDEGEKILTNLGITLLENGGTVVGATKTLMVYPRENLFPETKSGARDKDGISTRAYNLLLDHLLKMPLYSAVFLTSNEAFTPWKVFHSPPIRTIQIPLKVTSKNNDTACCLIHPHATLRKFQ